jgi:hypothetical protein
LFSHERDAGLWFATANGALSKVSAPARWAPDRTVPAEGMEVFDHGSVASVVWQDGMARDDAAVRWAVVGSRSKVPVRRREMRGARPTHVVTTDEGFVMLGTRFKMTPYRWTLTASTMEG